MCAASFVSNTQYPNFRPIATPNRNYFQKVIILRNSGYVVVEETYTTSWVEHAYLEPEVMSVLPMEDGRLEIRGAMQHPFYNAPGSLRGSGPS